MTLQQLKVQYDADDAFRIATNFIGALRSASYKSSPYNHWLLKNLLPFETATELSDLPFSPPKNMHFNGKRETNNSKRVYFNRENQDKFAVCQDVVEAFDSDAVRDGIKEIVGVDLSDSMLRVEYCQDAGDFWLEPHTDIKAKKFTLLIYISDNPALSNCGTDIYDSSPEHTLVYSAPYEFNTGLLFIPSCNTWHGFTRRSIEGIRKSLIVNYVTPEWRDKWELAY